MDINSRKLLMQEKGAVVPRERVNELYQKIDEYVYGMNRREIDMEKAYETISTAPNSESNAILNFWKGRFADPRLSFYKSSRVEENQSRAIAFYLKALDLDIEGMAENGDQYAQACLGLMYQYGRGVDKNMSTAVEWYRKAAEQGHADAHFYCGMMIHLCGIYEYIYGGYRNHLTKFECYCKAAEQGHAYAQYCLGDMYYLGDGVDQNYSTAVEWFRKAAEQGHAIAQRSLDRLTKKRRIVEKFDDLGLK